MIIGVTGYGATGASACIDLLKEFEGVQSFPSGDEFQLLQQPDGICDLKYYLVHAGRRLGASCMLKRFENNIQNSRIDNIDTASSGKLRQLTTEYFDRLIQVNWRGKSGFDPVDLKRFYDNYLFRRINRVINRYLKKFNSGWGWPPAHEQYFSYFDEKTFDEITSEYLKAVLEACGFSMTEPIILEQVFNTTHPTEGMEYFENAQEIIVDRDPRDVYIISNVTMKSVCGFMPNSGDAKAFVSYYRSLHTPKTDDPRVMYLQYEDLLFEYDRTIQDISKFVGLNHVKRGTYFKPECSINNTQQYLNYPELHADIKYIEESLSDMLYPFEEKRPYIKYTPANIKSFDRQWEADKQRNKQRNKQ